MSDEAKHAATIRSAIRDGRTYPYMTTALAAGADALERLPALETENAALREEERIAKGKLSAIDSAFNEAGVPWAGREREEIVREIIRERNEAKAWVETERAAREALTAQLVGYAARERTGDEVIAALRTREAEAIARADAAEAAGACDACMGRGDSPDCMCGGTGRASDAVIHLRERVLAAEAAVREATQQREASDHAAALAVREAERLREENTKLRRELVGALDGAEERRLNDLAIRALDRGDKLERALRWAHCCATIRDDGTCEGCTVSEALADAARAREVQPAAAEPATLCPAHDPATCGVCAPATEPARERVKPAQRCHCGMHEIPEGVDGVRWYHQRHDRERCVVEMPNARCWCGLLWSEHVPPSGHNPYVQRDESVPLPAAAERAAGVRS